MEAFGFVKTLQDLVSKPEFKAELDSSNVIIKQLGSELDAELLGVLIRSKLFDIRLIVSKHIAAIKLQF